MKDDRRKGERGAILAMSTIAMLSLLLATGLAVDVSHFYSVQGGDAKTRLYTAAIARGLAHKLNGRGIKSAVLEATKVLNKYDF